MCGRYASSRGHEELVVEFEVEEDHLDDPRAVEAKYNIAPTDTVPVVMERMEKPAPDESDVDALVTAALANDAQHDARAVRQLRPLRWGLVPSWSKDASGGARMINARLETLLDKPAFKKAALSRRCLVPADGWYEWQVSPTEKDAKGKPRKQPFFMSPADGSPGLALAGIYEFWRDRAADPDGPVAWLVTFAVITTAAEPGLDTIHDRMPLVLPKDRWAAWLDPGVKAAADVHNLTIDLPAGRFSALPITTRVNSVRNDGPALLEPAPADSLIGVVDPATGELLGGPVEDSLF
ncbi:SOS response-associated peptidase [Kineosporia mesophila]|uniref:Abasic site processing protein n=1 Tax=Kineosporia mesophila TaxID=566012 RepID=A0ABP6ZXW6_9ACTN|nr:SOS response-associated peptidase [Kineosporia mesophila]MCD5348486.1 SOS response-associated peptidase [Kineosporia mesophila]